MKQFAKAVSVYGVRISEQVLTTDEYAILDHEWSHKHTKIEWIDILSLRLH